MRGSAASLTMLYEHSVSELITMREGGVWIEKVSAILYTFEFVKSLNPPKSFSHQRNPLPASRTPFSTSTDIKINPASSQPQSINNLLPKTLNPRIRDEQQFQNSWVQSSQLLHSLQSLNPFSFTGGASSSYWPTSSHTELSCAPKSIL